MDLEKKEIVYVCVWGGGVYTYSFEQSDILSNHREEKTIKPINQGNDKTTLHRFKVTFK